nr:PREDICTED: uncharacterized protein LOC103312336 isoform X1 [Tribolium castaneum]|eukprot:XP_008190955.1 PREDICTED: uncharacterized protein LOC103312336 isoform X1 [Tribolium castaneum]
MAGSSQTPDPDNNFINAELQRREIFKFYEMFSISATLQGRVAYLLMSIHAVNPHIVKSFTNCDPKHYLFMNMLYGVAIMIYCRPSMYAISKFNRAAFSILGSLMFNHSSMLCYEWLVEKLSHRPYLLTFLGFLSGRIMMLHLLAYCYHVDSRYRGFHIRPYPEYESMYRQH